MASIDEFRRSARTTTWVAVVALAVSLPAWPFVEFDPRPTGSANATPAWAAGLFAVGVVALLALAVVLPIRFVVMVARLARGSGKGSGATVDSRGPAPDSSRGNSE